MSSKNRPDRLTFGNLAKNFLRDFTSADKGLWGTIVQLTFRPNRVVETFLFEDRKRFTRPTRYILIMLSTLALNIGATHLRHGKSLMEFLRPALVEEVSDKIDKAEEEVVADLIEEETVQNTGKEDELPLKLDLSDELNAALKDADKDDNILKYTSYLSVLFIPVTALVLWFCFPRRKYNFPENLAASAYISAHANVFTIAYLPAILFFDSPEPLRNTMAVVSGISFVYTAFAIIKVFVTKWIDLLIALGLYFVIMLCSLLAFFPAVTIVFLLLEQGVSKGFSMYGGKIFMAFLKLLLIVLVLAGVIVVRNKPRRWYVGLGISLVSLLVYLLV